MRKSLLTLSILISAFIAQAQTGNVGIGTTSPEFKLDVNTGGSHRNTFRVSNQGETIIAEESYSDIPAYSSHIIGLRARGTKESPL